MKLTPSSLLLALLLVALLLGAALLGGARLARAWRAWARRRRFRRARRGEQDAEELLQSEGYEIVARQPQLSWTVQVDGEEVPIELRPDLLVERRGALWVAEVKTGQKAPSVENAATRRQLLEYRLAVPDASGVLLVDMEEEELRRVVFPHERRGGRGRWAQLLAALILGLGLGAALHALLS